MRCRHAGGRARSELMSRAAQPRRRDRAATTIKLREAAMQVFAQRGFDAATTREVAQVAGVSEQLIQRYFGGKAGLLLAITNQFTQLDGAGPYNPPPVGGTVADEIADYLSYHLKRGEGPHVVEFARITYQRVIIDPSFAALMSDLFKKKREPEIRKRLQELQRKGLLRHDADVGAAAHIVTTFGFGLLVTDRIFLGRSVRDIKRAIATFAQIFARGIGRETSKLDGRRLK